MSLPADSILFSHPFGNQNVRALLRFFNQGNLLHSYFTTVNFPQDAKWIRCLPSNIRQQILRRSYDLSEKRIRCRPLRELIRKVSVRSGWSNLIRHETGWASVDAICRDQDRWVAGNLPTFEKLPEVVYGYEDSSSETFAAASRLGIRKVYEITIGHHAAARQIMTEEASLMPEFALTIESLWDSPEKLDRKEREMAQADLLIASSDFVQQTLLDHGVSPHKIVVTQFGAPSIPLAEDERSFPVTRPLRILFAGRVGQRKGIGYLLKAMQKIKRPDIELILMGEIIGDPRIYEPYRQYFHHEPPRSHCEFLRLMQTCDLLVLPTLFEGQALVILEAMKCGLPVITTRNSGAANLIREGRDGFVVPIRSVDALVEKFHWCADHREQLLEMGRAAQDRSAEFTWENYAKSIRAALENL